MTSPGFEVQLDTAGLSKALFSPSGVITEFLESYARQVVARAVLRAPVRTGNLRRSIRSEPAIQAGPFQANIAVIADAKYAEFVHEGTAPHTITAGPGKALRFKVKARPSSRTANKVIFRKSVNHPGTTARPFLRNAMEEVAAELQL